MTYLANNNYVKQFKFYSLNFHKFKLRHMLQSFFAKCIWEQIELFSMGKGGVRFSKFLTLKGIRATSMTSEKEELVGDGSQYETNKFQQWENNLTAVNWKFIEGSRMKSSCQKWVDRNSLISVKVFIGCLCRFDFFS